MPFDIGFQTALVWLALWYLLRGDPDWRRRVWVTVGVVASGVLIPEAGRILMFDHLGLNPLRGWWLLVLLVLLCQGGLFVELLGHHLQVALPRALLAWGMIMGAVAVKEAVCYRQYRAGLAAFAWHLVAGADLKAEKPVLTTAERARVAAERDREIAVAVKGLSARNVGSNALAPAAPAVKAVPRAALRDPGWEAAKVQLRIKGMAKSGRKTVLFVNDSVVEIGQCAGVDYADRRYVWKLVALNRGTPCWLPQGP